MDNKTMLEGILWDLKCLSDLFVHGTIESADNKIVRDTFLDSLNSVLEMQENLYILMSEEDLYKIASVSLKFRRSIISSFFHISNKFNL